MLYKLWPINRLMKRRWSRPLDRVEGPLKVSGRATYAAEYPVERLSYGVLVRAPFGSKSRTRSTSFQNSQAKTFGIAA